MKPKIFISLILIGIVNFSVDETFALEESYNKDRSLEVPYREQAVILSKEGFYPNRITVFKGEKVRFL